MKMLNKKNKSEGEDSKEFPWKHQNAVSNDPDEKTGHEDEENDDREKQGEQTDHKEEMNDHREKEEDQNQALKHEHQTQKSEHHWDNKKILVDVDSKVLERWKKKEKRK